MKIFILAAGNEERFDKTKRFPNTIKQLCPVRDETVLSRLMKMLKGRDCKILTYRKEIIKLYPKICVVPNNCITVLDTVLSSKHLWDMTTVVGEVCFLLADVIYTRKALDRILEPINKSHQWYGSFDEPFAFRFNEVMYKRVVESCEELIKSRRPQPTIWELYRYLTGVPLNKDWRDSWFFTYIPDKTDDIDYFKDYQAKMSSHYFEDKEFDL